MTPPPKMWRSGCALLLMWYTLQAAGFSRTSLPSQHRKLLLLESNNSHLSKSPQTFYRPLHAEKTFRNVVEDTNESAADRRRFLLGGTIFVASSVFSLNDASAATAFEKYRDEECNFSFSVPSDWIKTVQSLPDRRKIVFFFDPTQSSSDNNINEVDKNLIFIAYTPIRDDFTSLGSFGTVDQVAQMTILPKGDVALVDEAESVMLKSESKKSAYFFDYTIKLKDQPKRHFRTIFALAAGATGGAGSVLVTITAQSNESNYLGLKTVYDEVIDSYGKNT